MPVPVTGSAYIRLTDLDRWRAFHDAVFGWDVDYEIRPDDDATLAALGEPSAVQ